MSNSSGSAADKAQTQKAAAKPAATDQTTSNDPALQPVQQRMEQGQHLAKEAQLKVAERRPDEYVPDIGQVAGDEGARYLSDNEKLSTGERDQDAVNKDLFERAALTPAEKAEKGIAPMGVFPAAEAKSSSSK